MCTNVTTPTLRLHGYRIDTLGASNYGVHVNTNATPRYLQLHGETPRELDSHRNDARCIAPHRTAKATAISTNRRNRKIGSSVVAFGAVHRAAKVTAEVTAQHDRRSRTMAHVVIGLIHSHNNAQLKGTLGAEASNLTTRVLFEFSTPIAYQVSTVQ